MPKEAVVAGVRIETDHPLISDVVREALTSGRYEHKEARQLVRLIKKGERILELGGGLGLLSTVAAQTGLAEAIVVVEAHPGMLDCIRRTHALNGVSDRVELIHGAAVGEVGSGTRSFEMRRHFWASAAVADDAPAVPGRAERITVPALALGDLVRAHRPSLVVMDIEGGEVDALRGTPLPGVRKLLIEIHPNQIGPAGINHVFNFMMKRRFHYDAGHSSGQVVCFRRASAALGGPRAAEAAPAETVEA